MSEQECVSKPSLLVLPCVYYRFHASSGCAVLARSLARPLSASTVSGGRENVAAKYYATVSGGTSNSASQRCVFNGCVLRVESVCLSFFLSFFCMSDLLSVCLSVRPSVCMPVVECVSGNHVNRCVHHHCTWKADVVGGDSAVSAHTPCERGGRTWLTD